MQKCSPNKKRPPAHPACSISLLNGAAAISSSPVTGPDQASLQLPLVRLLLLLRIVLLLQSLLLQSAALLPQLLYGLLPPLLAVQCQNLQVHVPVSSSSGTHCQSAEG
jgi:hypothetical protein